MSAHLSGAVQLPRRATFFLTILAAHVLIAYAFASGMVRNAIEKVAEPIAAKVIRREPTPLPPPPPSDPNVRRVEIEVPVPVGPVYPTDDTGNTIHAVRERIDVPVAPTPPAPPEPILLQGRHQLPNTGDYYPPPAIRLGQEGAAVVRACVDVNGKRIGNPTIAQSSGFTLLDGAAIELAKDGRYARSTQGGEPIPNCHQFRVVFKIR